MKFSRCAYSATRAAQDLLNARLLVGLRLSQLSHQQYCFNGEKDLTDIGPLEWRCGHQIVSMYLLSDGESVGADLLPFDTPAAFEIEEDVTCSWNKENLLTGTSTAHLEGQLIQEVEGIMDLHEHHDARLVGFKVTFEAGDFLVFLNQGDEGVLLVNQPPAVVEGIQTRWVTTLS